jgi:Uma2 family endonuclease
MTEPQRRSLTAEDLYDLPLDDIRAELVRGDLVCEPPAGFEHGVRAIKIGHHLERFIEDRPIGVVCGAETGFVLFRDPDTVRAPDAAFVTRERAERVADREKYFEGAPDLAAEVVSPGDSRREVAEKVHDYLAAGTRQVWVIDPRRRTVTVHRPGADPRVLGPDDLLEGGDLLPGFSLPVSRLVG